MRKIFIGSILMWGLFAFAQEFPLLHNFKPTMVDTTVPTERLGTGTVLFTTLNGLAAQVNSAASQRTGDFGPPGCTSGNCYQSVAADDFVVPNTVTNWIIDSVEVVGTYDGADGQPEPGPAESVNVYIMSNDVVNSLPDSTDLAGSALFAFEELGYTDNNSGDFFIDLSGVGSVSLPPGTYWIIVQANMNFESGGREQQWGWAESSLNPDTGSTVGFESAWFQNFAVLGASCVNAWGQRISDCGVTNTGDPTPVEPDLAFELRGTALVPGISVSPTSGLETSEGGATASFTVVLDAEPTASVSIDVSSSDTTLGTVSTGTLTFTTGDWNVAQTVTITGQDDAPPVDGDRPYTIVLDPAVSADGDYSGLDPDDVSVTNLDNDIPGIQVLPISGLVTGENGTNATFAINATTAPASDVTVPLTSSDTSEVTVPASVVLPAGSTNAVNVTVTAVNDDIQDGNQAFSIVTGDPTSGDATYDALDGADVADVSGTNEDNDGDSAGVSITEVGGGPLSEPLITGEPNLSDSFDVVLTSEPTADVILTMASSDNTEASVSPGTLTFTSANWDTAQTVTVTGLDDSIQDGAVNYSIITNPASSGDGNYDGIDPANISAINNDDGDVVGVTVTPSAIPLVTDEQGTLSPTFTVVLDSEPAANVTISVGSGSPDEGTASTASLTFTAGNWDTAQTVTVTGVDDILNDGDQVYAILLGNTVSTDPTYSGITVDDVACRNLDDGDVSGITVTPSETPLTTDEAGTLSPSFDVVLVSPPIADVTIGVSSSDTDEGAVSDASLTFTSANWDTPQTVVVTGVDDLIDDSNVLYEVRFADSVSTDPAYSGLTLDPLPAVNLDNDTANVIVTPAGSLPVNVSEDGLVTDVLTVSLTIPPSDDVVVSIESSNTAEGTVSASLVQLTFTPANWETPQSVNVQGVDDMVDDGDVTFAYTVDVTSADGSYDAVVVAPLQAINADNDDAGITVDAPAELTTTEGGGTATFTVVLDSQPVSNVDIQIASSDVTEASVSSAEVTFTTKDWNVPQTVTVTGIDDAIADGPVSYTVTVGPVSGDPLYAAIDPADLDAINVDDETAGIRVSPTSGLVTDESGASDSFTVVLDSMPTGDVTMTLGSDDTTEGTADTGSLTFTNANWDVPQTVTVTGVDDVDSDSDVAYSIVLDAATSTDGNYNGINPADVSVTNIDDDTASVIVTASEPLTTTETGGSDSFQVRLGSSPSADVSITVTSNDNTEGTAVSGVAVLTFTSANWDVDQTVSVVGEDDFIIDGTVGYAFGISVSSADGDYDGLPVSDISAQNTDNDAAAVVVTAAGGVEPVEVVEGTTNSSFSLVLESEPSADVVIGVSSSDTTEATVAPASVTFTSANWNIPQTILVTNVDDNVVDGTVAFSLVTAAATSGDADYNGLDPRDLSAQSIDNDFSGILASSADGFPVITNEAGKGDSFTVELTSEPTATVTIPVSSSDTTEGTVSPSSLTFTTANWDVPQTVTVTGVDDDEARADGSVSYSINLGPASSSDSDYNGLTRDVSAVNEDDSNDIVGITVTPNQTPLQTSENGGADTFTVVLTSQPSANVAIDFASDNAAEGTASPSTLTFTPANWATAQTVTVTGVDDGDVEDGDVSYSVVSSPAVSDDGNYNGLNADDVSAVNQDNDGAIPSEDYDIVATPGEPFVVLGPDAEVGIYSFDPDTGEWTFECNATVVNGVGVASCDADEDTVYGVGDPNGAADPSVPAITTVPTLGEWGMIFFVLLLMAVALTHMRRQRLA